MNRENLNAHILDKLEGMSKSNLLRAKYKRNAHSYPQKLLITMLATKEANCFNKLAQDEWLCLVTFAIIKHKMIHSMTTNKVRQL